MRVVVVDYGSGNLASAARALQTAAERAGIAAEVAITGDAAAVAAADRVVLPGQGAFADCAAGLRAATRADASSRKRGPAACRRRCSMSDQAKAPSRRFGSRASTPSYRERTAAAACT